MFKGYFGRLLNNWQYNVDFLVNEACFGDLYIFSSKCISAQTLVVYKNFVFFQVCELPVLASALAPQLVVASLLWLKVSDPNSLNKKWIQPTKSGLRDKSQPFEVCQLLHLYKTKL